jgi:RNA polymerase sigma factor (TIGR02999 family)
MFARWTGRTAPTSFLVDAARARASTKRGGHLQRVEETTALTLDALRASGSDRAADICALNDALDALAKQEPRRAKVIELRYFDGLSVEETAEALGVFPQTVLRDWKLARAWLAVELRRSSHS